MAAAPKSILEIQYNNPAPPAGDFASTGGGDFPLNSFPLSHDYEWTQVLAPGDEYDRDPVGASGWVINPHSSSADLPMTHPFLTPPPNFVGDWEFAMLVDDQYANLLSRCNNFKDEGDGTIPQAEVSIAQNTPGLQVGSFNLMNVEVEQNLFPNVFRKNVSGGDRVATFGRWILDQAHPNKHYGAFRTEIHPPLLIATGSVQAGPIPVGGGTGDQFTRVLFMSRPWLTGQRFCKDPKNAYDDANDDDGAFKDHAIKEFANLIFPFGILSTQVHFYSKIKQHPFVGAHLFHFIVRPPAPPAPKLGGVVTQAFQMEISFNFTVRTPCAVQVISPTQGQVDVLIAMNDVGYTPPPLEPRQDTRWLQGDLNQVFPPSGDLTFGIATGSLAAIAALIGGPVGDIQLGVMEAAWNSNGIKTSIYGPCPEPNMLVTSGAVLDVPPDKIPAGQGIHVDNIQPFPVFGWLVARWAPHAKVGGPGR